MDPAIYVLIFSMAALLIVALILSNSSTTHRGGAVMPHPIFPHPDIPRFGPYREHGGQANGSGMLY
jgi:hypothetical protein